MNLVSDTAMTPAGLAAQKTAGHAEVRRLESTVAQMEAELRQLGLEGETAGLSCRHTGLPCCWQWSSQGAAYMSMRPQLAAPPWLPLPCLGSQAASTTSS